MATVNDTLTTYPSGYDSTDYSYASVNSSYPLSNPVGQPSTQTSTYSRWNITTGSSAESWLYYLFDCSSIPEGATIDSVSCSVRCSISSTNTNRINTKTIQLYSGSTAKGSTTSVTSTASTSYTMTCGDWTRDELQNCRLKFYAKRGTNQTTGTQYYNFYGATLTVSYTYNDGYYTIISSATGGTINPDGETNILAGESITFSMSANDGYIFDSMTVNGISVIPTETTVDGNAVYTYTIYDVQEEYTVIIIFSKESTLYMKVNGTWTAIDTVTIYKKISGVWVEQDDITDVFDTEMKYLKG